MIVLYWIHVIIAAEEEEGDDVGLHPEAHADAQEDLLQCFMRIYSYTTALHACAIIYIALYLI